MFGNKNQQDPDIFFVSIFDTKAGNFRQPIQVENKYDAIRSYETLIRKNPDDQLVTNAEDFQLFLIGSYSKKTGVITSHQPEHFANLFEIKSAVLRREQPSGH